MKAWTKSLVATGITAGGLVSCAKDIVGIPGTIDDVSAWMVWMQDVSFWDVGSAALLVGGLLSLVWINFGDRIMAFRGGATEYVPRTTEPAANPPPRSIATYDWTIKQVVEHIVPTLEESGSALDILRQAAIDNKITVWGRTTSPEAMSGSPLLKIDPAYWHEIPFDIISCAFTGPPERSQTAPPPHLRAVPGPRYGLRVNSEEIRALKP